MNRIPVVSKAIKAVGYDPALRHLEIEYHNGQLYRHYNVPKRVHIKLVNATSPGNYLNEAVKPFFEAVEIRNDSDTSE
jgi:hypothetical protein